MKRIDMAPGEPAQFTHQPPNLGSTAYPQVESFEPALSESQQVDLTYAFWNSLFARPPAQLRERLVELDRSRAGCDDFVEQGKLDSAINAITFVLRTRQAMPDAGITLL